VECLKDLRRDVRIQISLYVVAGSSLGVADSSLSPSRSEVEVDGETKQIQVHATAMAQLTGWETTHLRHCSAADQPKRRRLVG
jgi:hypothetical protein